MRKRADTNLDLEKASARTIEHTKQELDLSRSSVYALARMGKLELIYLDPEKKRLPRITARSIRKALGEQSA
jgi:hypothetical protein